MKNLQNFTLAIGLFILLFSCKKVESIVGQDGIDNESLLASQAMDTFKIETTMFVEDSIISDNTSSALLGSFNDPITGYFSSEIFTQFQLSGLNPDFGNLSEVKIDSCVLGLEYKGYYGNLDAQTFEVFEMTEGINIDSTYYSFQTKTVSATPLMQIGKEIQTPDPINATVIGGTKVDPQLRLFLDTNFARNLMNETVLSPSNFASNESFTNYFKGLNIRTNNVGQASGKGGLFYFNLNDPLSKLTIYYTQNGEEKTFDLLINEECADFNHVNINNTTQVQDVIDNPALGQNEFFIQANKSRAKVMFSTIDDIPKNSIIQYAKLELPVSFYNYDVFFPSAQITVSAKLDILSDQLYLLQDDSKLPIVGNYNNYDKNYEIDLRKYVQDVVNGVVVNEGIYLSPSKMATSGERIVLNGANSQNKKQPKLKIFYTTY